MKKLGYVLGLLFLGGLLYAVPSHVDAKTKDEQEIRALIQQMIAAFKAKDITTLMSAYVPNESLVVFDLTPPLHQVGAQMYQKGWEAFLAAFPGPVEVEMTEMSIETEGTLGVSHDIDHWVLTDKEGKKITLTFRATNVYRKIDGKWRIIHEHNSFPVDLTTGRADLGETPQG
jgi:uncharacterized protein (TIGR02246 family)